MKDENRFPQRQSRQLKRAAARFRAYNNQLRRTGDKIWSTLHDHRAKSHPDILIGQVCTWNCFHKADPERGGRGQVQTQHARARDRSLSSI